jgi:ABC-2 type transport system ATP-binding protein
MLGRLSGLRTGTVTRRVKEVLDTFGLSEHAGQMMNTLSKGQVQRAGLAQALVHEPDILLLDEPMSGLDPYWRYRVQGILHDYKAEGGTILFSSHILVDVERLADQIALINNGRIRWVGRLSDLPRKTRGYEIICRTRNPQILSRFVMENRVEDQPDGSVVFSIPVHLKEDILHLASDGEIILESIRPLQEEIEEVIFNFSKDPQHVLEEGPA